MQVQTPATRTLSTAALCLVFFACITWAVTNASSSVATLDKSIDLLLLTVRTPIVTNVVLLITAFGASSLIIALTIVIFLYFTHRRQRAYAIGLAATVALAGGIGYVLKSVIARARPDGIIPAITETSFSFPSGHATISVAFYGFLAYVLYRRFPRHRTLIITVCTLIALLIGLSRLYLGVHFPSDIVAGYLLGGFSLILGIALATRLEKIV